MAQQLKLTLTGPARAFIKGCVTKPGSIPGLLWGWEDDDVRERWMVVEYPCQQAQELVEMFREVGYPVLFEVDGMELCVPQSHIAETLEGKILDMKGGLLVLR